MLLCLLLTQLLMAQSEKAPAVISDCQITGADGEARQELQKKIRSRRDAILDCYLKSRKQNPGLEGSLSMTVRIDPAGKVVRVSKDSSSVADPLVSSCIESRLKGWKFQGGQTDSVTLKIKFRFDLKQKDRPIEPGLL